MNANVYGWVVVAALLGAGHSLSTQNQASAIPQQLSAAEVSQREAVVFDALDLSRPELASVAAAWKTKDTAKAEKALAQYLRTRTSVHWGSTADPNHSATEAAQDKAAADEAVAGRLRGGGSPLVHAFPAGNIDWSYNETYHEPGIPPDDEWQWQLNRMEFWGNLGRAYKATGDERYAKTFVREMRSWIAQCPVPDHAANVAPSAWRTIEAGIRVGGSWPAAFFAFHGSPSMTDADLVTFAGAFLDHGRYLRSFHTGLNWFTMEMSGLYATGAAFPEFKEAADWRSFAASQLAAEAQKEFLADGALEEISTSYQNVALGNILKIAQVARWTGRTAELPAGYSTPLEKGYTWQLDIMAPDRTSPKINDAGENELPSLFATMAVENFPKRNDFKWVARGGEGVGQPSFTSIFLDRSGFAVMRSGWSRNDNYLLYRLGPPGLGGHMHQDKLGIVFYAYGREIMFDSGGGNYEHSKWRQWATSAFSHNCLIVDGLGQARINNLRDPAHSPNLTGETPVDAHWQTNKVFDFASADYTEGNGPEHLHPATQQRDVLFLKPDLYVVADRLRPNDAQSHQYQARWHLLTIRTSLDSDSHSLVTTDPGVANAAVIPLLKNGLEVAAVSGQETPEILGWNILRYTNPQRAPATTLLHTRTGAGPQLILTLIAPLKPGETNPVTAVTPGSDGHSATVTLTDGRKLLISSPGERGITVEETLSGGETGRIARSGTN